MRSSRDGADCAATCCRGISRCSTRWSASGCRSTSSTGARIGGSRSVSTTSIRSAHRTTRSSSSSTTPSRSSAASTSRACAGTRASTRATSRGASITDGVVVCAVPRRRDRRRRRLRPRAGRARARALAARDAATLPRRIAPSPSANVWPDGVEPELTDVDVAISRTEPAFDGLQSRIARSAQLHLDAIAAARHCIFAENQYFTSRLDHRGLRAPTARGPTRPRSRCISPFTQSGWLEISTMGVLRGRNHRMLRAADAHGRYRLYSPTLPWLDDDQGCLNVHSKVLIVDDEFAMIGSANLADRSMGTDTECNLAIEARGDPRMKRVDRRLARTAARRASRPLAGGSRRGCRAHEQPASRHRRARARGRATLKVDEPELDPRLDALVPDHHVLDPEQPIDPDTIVADLVPHEEARASARARLIGVAPGRRARADGARVAFHPAAGMARARSADRARPRRCAPTHGRRSPSCWPSWRRSGRLPADAY